MNISDILSAQIKVWDQLQKITLSNKLGNAYLFSGPPGCGKESIALQFAQLLNCRLSRQSVCGSCPSCLRFSNLQHENLKIIFPLPVHKNKNNNEIDEKDFDLITNAIVQKSKDPFFKIQIPKANRILIKSIRSLRKSLYLKNETLGRRVVIVFDAHLLSTGQSEAGNAFLKMLEEPPDNTTIILVTDHEQLLLSTILSRCQRIRFSNLTNEFMEKWCQKKMIKNSDISLLIGLSRGNMHQARFLMTHTSDDLIKLINNLIESICYSNPDQWRKFIQTYSKMAKQNQSIFVFHFMLLKIWFYSANRLMKKLDDVLHNTTLKLEMNRFINKKPNTDFYSIVFELEETIKTIPQNLYMPLVLINFLISIQKHFKE